jgi:hypothetical protein
LKELNPSTLGHITITQPKKLRLKIRSRICLPTVGYNLSQALLKGSRCPRGGWIEQILNFLQKLSPTLSPFHPLVPKVILLFYRTKVLHHRFQSYSSIAILGM